MKTSHFYHKKSNTQGTSICFNYPFFLKSNNNNYPFWWHPGKYFLCENALYDWDQSSQALITCQKMPVIQVGQPWETPCHVPPLMCVPSGRCFYRADRVTHTAGQEVMPTHPGLHEPHCGSPPSDRKEIQHVRSTTVLRETDFSVSRTTKKWQYIQGHCGI